MLDGLEQRLLNSVLGRREVASTADEDAKDLRGEVPQELVHSVAAGASPRNGRTSIHSLIGRPPGPGAEERNAAAS